MRNPAKGRTVSALLALALSGALAAMLVVLSGAAAAQETRAVALDVDKTVSPRTVQVGDLQVFTVRVTNHGSTRAQAVRMRDPLPSEVRFVRASTSRHVPGSCGIDQRVVTCRLGTLRANRSVTVKIRVRPVVAGSYTNRAFASFDNSTSRVLGAPGASDAATAVSVARGR